MEDFVGRLKYRVSRAILQSIGGWRIGGQIWSGWFLWGKGIDGSSTNAVKVRWKRDRGR